jgi:hypothetical protein
VEALQQEMRTWHAKYKQAQDRSQWLAAQAADPDIGLKAAFQEEALTNADMDVATPVVPPTAHQISSANAALGELEEEGRRLKSAYDAAASVA